jgi:type VI secretion system protein ImpK
VVPSAPPAATELPTQVGLNPLVRAASALLSLVGKLRNTVSHPDVEGLRRYLVQEVQKFESEARAHGADSESVLTARYALCSLLDETVLGSPWAAESIWSEQSLLSEFHKEAWGGERFFQVLDRVMHEPARNLDLLELLSICLSLGFQGKYGVGERGRGELEELQNKVYAIIRTQRGEFERDLSPRWQGVEDRRNPLMRYVPLWVVGAVAAVLLLGIYMGFRLSLARHADPVFRDLVATARSAPPPVIPPSAPPGRSPDPAPDPEPRPIRLPDALLVLQKRGLIDLREHPDQITVVIRGDGLFASGSAEVTADYRPLLAEIAEALGQVPGEIVVTGHTDNVPIRSLRFPNNWALSRERAVNVVDEIAPRLGSRQRLRAEGLADTKPLAPNETKSGRARNRRVEIALFPRRGAP